MHQKLVSDPFLLLANISKQPSHARNYFKNKIFWKRIIKKFLKSHLYFFFQTQSLLMDKVIKNKRCLELVTRRSKDCETSSKIMLLVIYYLTKFDDVINIKRFLRYSKNYICKLMQANLWHHKLFHFHLPFCIWKLWKGREKITKIWISR